MFLQNMISGLVTSLLLSSHFFILPHDPTYGYNYIIQFIDPSRSFHSLVVYILYGLCNTYIMAKITFTMSSMQDILILSYFIYGDLISKEIRLGNGRNGMRQYKTAISMRKSFNLSRIYRMLQILLKMLIEAFGLIVVVAHLVMLAILVYCQISLLLYWSRLTYLTKGLIINLLVIGLIAWIFSLDMLGRLVVESTKSVKSWNRVSMVVWGSRETVQYMRKFNKSCPPLMISFKSFYKIKRSTVLSFMKLVSNLTFRALISINKHSK